MPGMVHLTVTLRYCLNWGVDVKIGALAEIFPGENRVSLTPESSVALGKLGHTCVVQAGAGAKAGFSDAMYAKAGVEVLVSAADVVAAADVLVKMKKDLPGTVKFIFQPAEEGSLPGIEGGARLMVKEGVLENPKVDAVFGLHIQAQTEVGRLTYRPGGEMASSDVFSIKVKGKSAHGAYPWLAVDPIVTAAQIILGLQTIVSRQAELTEDAVVLTVGMVHGGVRSNIIPEQVELTGTIRCLNKGMQQKVWAAVRRTATGIAESAGATAEVDITNYAPITYNDPALTSRMVPSLQRAAGAANVTVQKAVTGAEDFAFYQEKVPGLFVFVGGMPVGKDPATTAPHHTAGFFVDESGLTLGVRTLATLALDYLNGK